MTLYSYLITFSLTCGLRTVYLISLKNLICVDIVKMSSKVLSFTSFLHNIISNNFSQHWRAARNQSAGRMRPTGRGLDSTDVEVQREVEVDNGIFKFIEKCAFYNE